MNSLSYNFDISATFDISSKYVINEYNVEFHSFKYIQVKETLQLLLLYYDDYVQELWLQA